jgi:hypothetical protein
MAGEHEVSIAENQVRDCVRLDDGVEEHSSYRRGGVWMSHWNEVHRL